MINRNYYCLIAGLPDIVADEKKLSLTSVTFKEMLREDLSKTHFELAQLYYLPYDHKNLLNFLFKKNAEWDEKGNYNKELIEKVSSRKSFKEAELAKEVDMLPYFLKFLNLFYSEEGIDNYYVAELILTTDYYNYLSESSNKFVKQVADHERKVGNVMAALSGRKYEIQYDNNLIGDDDITSAIRKSRARDFGISEEFPELEELIQIFETENLVDREYKLDLYKWQYLDEITFFNYFSIEKILAYIQKLFITERWYSLDKEKGQNMLNKILEELKSGFKLSDEFTMTYGRKK